MQGKVLEWAFSAQKALKIVYSVIAICFIKDLHAYFLQELFKMDLIC